MSTIDDLKAARELYAAAPSHALWGHHPTGGSHCPITASIVATNDDAKRRIAVREALSNAIGLVYNRGNNEPLIRWNAAASTEEVLAAFDTAIATLEAKVEPEPEPEGWAIFIDHGERLTRVRANGLDHLWPGTSPVDAVQRFRDSYPDMGYEALTFYVNSRRGAATGFGMTRVKFEQVPTTTYTTKAVAS